MSEMLNLKTNKMSKKFKFQLRGTEFQLPITAIHNDTCNENQKYIYMNAKYCASIIKQYVKKNYPTLKVWATSDVYSGGSSVRINVSNTDGTEITDKNIWEDISSWKYTLQGGSFNGMIDMYEMREDSVTTQNGTPMKYFPSYVFIENRPKWDSVEYWYNKIVTLGEKLEDNITYMGKGVQNKVELAIAKGL